MALHTFLLIVFAIYCAFALPDNAGIHFPIYRRGGRFVGHESANFSRLSSTVDHIEQRYARTHREVDDNRLVRRWRPASLGDIENDEGLLAAGGEGIWYARIDVGEPPQMLEVEIDMLSPDFYTLMTTSGQGSKYDTFASNTFAADESRVHPLCRSASELFHLPGIAESVRLEFPACNPAKASQYTLGSSGTILGLSPWEPAAGGSSLSRLSNAPLLEQLLAQEIIHDRFWSLTVLTSDVGFLSLGGTLAREFATVRIRTSLELDNIDNILATPNSIDDQVSQQLALAFPRDMSPDSVFRWTDLQAARGWWTTLMAGVWINGAKVLRNQAVVFDVNCPFILAPRGAIGTFYKSIGGAKRIPPDTTNGEFDGFFAFPCLTYVNIAFEFAGWNFPVLTGEGTRADGLHGPAGGRFSLGKLGNGTGFCVGIVVESRMEHADGMQDVWVLGEPFFRGLGVVFDEEKGRIGMRTY